MKLDKDKKQKILLGVILAVGALYCYFTLLLGPLTRRESGAVKGIAALEPQIKDARAQLMRTRSMETGDPNAAMAQELFGILKKAIPDGPPIAWFPQKLSEFFREEEVPRVSSKWAAEAPEPALAGYKTSIWTVEIPKIEFAKLGATLAALENREGLLEIRDLQIGADTLDMRSQRVHLTLSTLVKQ